MELYLTENHLKYILDYNGAAVGTGFCKGGTINPKIARAISVRGGGGDQRCNVSNFVSDVLPDDFPAEELREMIWGKRQ